MQHRKLPKLADYEHQIFPNVHEEQLQQTLGFSKVLIRVWHFIIIREDVNGKRFFFFSV